MDPDAAWQIITVVLLVFLSAFFSSTETAFTAANRMRMRTLAEEKNKSAMRVIKLLDEPSKMLSTILIGNNIVNLTASSLTTSIAINQFGGDYAVGVATFILTLAVLLFGEITPKTIATRNADKLSLIFVNIIYPLTIVMTPIVHVVNFIANIVLRILRIDPNAKSQAITENELMTIIDVSREEGVIENEEHEMIANVVDFGDSMAKDIMIPRVDMVAIDVEATYSELMELFRAEMYSRFPVYKETNDNIVGIISLKDVVFYKGNAEDFRIEKYMRKPYYTYETKKTNELLQEMRKSTHPMAIVLDEYGATAGIITVEDLIEEIIGDIRDEYDTDEKDDIIQIKDDTYIVSGNAKLDEFYDLGLEVDTSDYESIAGHVIYLLDRLPKVGDTCTDGRFTFVVTKMDRMRISELKLIIAPEIFEE
ncbi:MAG: hemolysin family protein [Lachnospiraceae bacterium]|nr:hemolysin family protein [Lachnospiraceae bacterium]